MYATTAAERSKAVDVKMTHTDGSLYTTVNSFNIAAEIRQLVGEVHTAKPAADGGLLVTTCAPAQTETLHGLERFMSKPATATIDKQPEQQH